MATRDRTPLCRFAWLVCVLAFTPGQARADEAPPAIDVPAAFEATIRPLLATHCGECHGKQKRSGKLNLATAEGLSRGGESGPAIVPGDVEQSLLWQRVASGEMPPEAPLPDESREALRAWIAAGAPGLPRREDLAPGSDHWAFRRIERPAVPATVEVDALVNDVDRFIVAPQHARGLKLGTRADRATLIRRLAFDLTGLPPTPEEIAAFLTDDADDAYPRLVERFLSSPRFGERWGRHWLDAAGYADSNGYFNADTDRPLAYRYRDWVIRATNDDLPFDRFLAWQIAGDRLCGYQPGGDVTPEMVDPLTATHFLRNCQDGTGESDGNDLERTMDRYTVLEGNVQLIGSALLGLTMQCCRCHDHKFEPVTQRDYYGLQAVLLPAYLPSQWRKPNERVIDVGTVAERERNQAENAAIDRAIKALDDALAEMARPLRRTLVVERLAALDDAAREEILAAYDASEDHRTDRQRELAKEHESQFKVTSEQLAERWPEYKAQEAAAGAEKERHGAARPAPLEKLAVVADWNADPPEHHILARGDYQQPAELALPAPPEFLGGFEAPLAESDQNRRLALARWLTSRDNPLVARVAVNRVWMHHFGRGIVATPDNFGYTGAEPSHPELLDFLAMELIDSGWSMKRVHRLIVGSATYQQSSRAAPEAVERDPDNALWTRAPLRRLEAECVRDAMLALGGQLDRTMYGPYVATQRGDDGRVAVADDAPGARRRSIYLQQRRTQVESLLAVFDAPSIVTNCVARGESTVPLQALCLLNSEFVVHRAEALATRLRAAGLEPSSAQIELACLLAWGRAPRAEERQAIVEFFAAAGGDLAGPPEAISESIWRDFCQMLLASNQFLYVE